jgi:hypothetical protein
MLNRQVTVAVAAMCCGVSPAKLRKLMKAAGMTVGKTVAFGDAVDACSTMERQDEEKPPHPKQGK